MKRKITIALAQDGNKPVTVSVCVDPPIPWEKRMTTEIERLAICALDATGSFVRVQPPPATAMSLAVDALQEIASKCDDPANVARGVLDSISGLGSPSES